MKYAVARILLAALALFPLARGAAPAMAAAPAPTAPRPASAPATAPLARATKPATAPATVAATAPTTAPASAAPHPWTHQKFLNDPRHFQFAIVTDNSGGTRPGVFEEAVAKLNLMRPRFVMSVGDLVLGYSKEADEVDRMWDGFQGMVARLRMPFYYVAGNHDYSNKMMAKEWARRFGRPYYSFVHQDVLFLCLNTEDPPSTRGGSIGPEQVKWIEKTLAENPKVRWTLVFMHRPLWMERGGRTGAENGWSAVDALLRAGERKFTVFAGHVHTYHKEVRGGREYFDLATTGGGTQSLPSDVRTNALGVILGRFDHFAWVTMTDDGPEIANVMLDGVWGDDLRTSENAAFTDALMQGPPVWLDPITTREAKFTGAATKLHVTNDSDVTLRMRGTFERSAQLIVEPSEIYLEVPPKSQKSLDVRITAELPAQVKVLLPIPLHWKLEYAMTERGRFSLPFRVQSISRYAITPLLPIPKRANAAIVDGKLDEWDNLAIQLNAPAEVLGDPRGYHGEADASARFAVQYDDRFLYVAARVIDDQVVLDRARVRPTGELEDFKGVEINEVFDRGTAFTRQLDGIEIRVDARPDPARSLSRGMNPLGTSAFIAVHPASADGKRPRLLYRGNRLPRGTQVQSVQVEGGYAVEAAIPIEYVHAQQGADWSQVRVNVSINDVDGAEETPVRLPWQPSWRDEMNVVGSGTFERSR